jgi:hypothetical protein
MRSYVCCDHCCAMTENLLVTSLIVLSNSKAVKGEQHGAIWRCPTLSERAYVEHEGECSHVWQLSARCDALKLRATMTCMRRSLMTKCKHRAPFDNKLFIWAVTTSGARQINIARRISWTPLPSRMNPAKLR